MKTVASLAALLSSLALASDASATDPKVKMIFIDHSNANLTAPCRLKGGMKGRTCVVAACVMLVPLTSTAKAMRFCPPETATAFDALSNSTWRPARRWPGTR